MTVQGRGSKPHRAPLHLFEASRALMDEGRARVFAHDAIHLDVYALLGIKLLPAIRGSRCDLFSQLLPPPLQPRSAHTFAAHRPRNAAFALFNHSKQTGEDTPPCNALEVGGGGVWGGRGGRGRAPEPH